MNHLMHDWISEDPLPPFARGVGGLLAIERFFLAREKENLSQKISEKDFYLSENFLRENFFPLGKLFFFLRNKITPDRLITRVWKKSEISP